MDSLASGLKPKPQFWGAVYKMPLLRQFYDYLTIMQKLRSTYDVLLTYHTSYEERKAFLG